MRLFVILISLFCCIFSYCQYSPITIKKAKKFHEDFLSVDSHTDTPLHLYHDKKFNIGKKHTLKKDRSCVDIPRMYKGKLDAVFFAVFLGQGQRNDSAYDAVYKKTIGIFDAIFKDIEKNKDVVGFATCPEDAYTLKNKARKLYLLALKTDMPLVWIHH